MISEEIRRRVKDLKGRLREEELRRGMAEEEKERARRETKESVARVVHAGEIRTVATTLDRPWFLPTRFLTTGRLQNFE